MVAKDLLALCFMVLLKQGLANLSDSDMLGPSSLYNSESQNGTNVGPVATDVSDSSVDVAVLELFRIHVTKDPLGVFNSWNATIKTPCSWFGIVCNNDGRVVSLLLGSKRLEGTLDGTLQGLSFLEFLDIHNNSFRGPVPSELGNLQQLQVLDVRNNQLSGEFPSSIVNLRHLIQLDISDNNFSGSIVQPVGLKDFKYSNNPSLVVKNGNKKGGPRMSILEIISVIITLSILAFAVFYCWLKFQRKYRKENIKGHSGRITTDTHNWKDIPFFPGFLYMHIRNFSLKELKEATRDFSDDCLLGTGGFGMVYKATLETGEIVALKRASIESVQGSDEFQNEVKLLSKVHHKHLVNLIGFCGEACEQILVYEFIPNGSLLDHLSGVYEPLTWRQRVRIAIGAAKGLSYLHEGCSPPVIHRDMKPSNILLDYNLEAKVSDFGLSKHGPTGDESHVSTLVKGTLGYLDPHYYLSFHLNTSSDVYSFGVILLQLVTARPAIDHERKRSQYNIISWAASSIENNQLEHIIDPSLARQGYNREVMLVMAKLGLRCTCKDLKLRPTMSYISQELERALKNSTQHSPTLLGYA